MAKVLRRHHLGTARQRVAALASLAAADAGHVTDAALEGSFGSCLFATHPGQVVVLDTFYVGRSKGVGAVWQLTAVDVATRTAVLKLAVGDTTAKVAAGFLDHLKKSLRKLGITLTGILSDNGPEFSGKDFRDNVVAMGLAHRRIPPRSPNHNAVCERFHGTVLAEFFRPPFHRCRVDDVAPAGQVVAGVHLGQQRAPSEPRELHAWPYPAAVKRDLKNRLRQTAA